MDEKNNKIFILIPYLLSKKTFVDPSPQTNLIKMSNNTNFIPFHICFIDEESRNLKFSMNDYLMVPRNLICLVSIIYQYLFN